MSEISINEMRSALNDILEGSPVYQEDVSQKTDEQLLNTNLQLEYELDSLDFEELLQVINSYYNIEVDEEDMWDSSFYQEPTVRNFIKLCHDRGHY